MYVSWEIETMALITKIVKELRENKIGKFP